jgi:hypothetical protein
LTSLLDAIDHCLEANVNLEQNCFIIYHLNSQKKNIISLICQYLNNSLNIVCIEYIRGSSSIRV